MVLDEEVGLDVVGLLLALQPGDQAVEFADQIEESLLPEADILECLIP